MESKVFKYSDECGTDGWTNKEQLPINFVTEVTNSSGSWGCTPYEIYKECGKLGSWDIFFWVVPLKLFGLELVFAWLK